MRKLLDVVGVELPNHRRQMLWAQHMGQARRQQFTSRTLLVNQLKLLQECLFGHLGYDRGCWLLWCRLINCFILFRDEPGGVSHWNLLR